MHNFVSTKCFVVLPEVSKSKGEGGVPAEFPGALRALRMVVGIQFPLGWLLQILGMSTFSGIAHLKVACRGGRTAARRGHFTPLQIANAKSISTMYNRIGLVTVLRGFIRSRDSISGPQILR
jgi:hypothetical protein